MLLFLILSNLLWAQTNQGVIPRYYSQDPASDLIYQGKELLPFEVDQLIEESKGKFDISLLNPVESSDLWKNNLKQVLKENENIHINYMEEVEFHSPVASRTGNFRFNVLKDQTKFYHLYLSKNIRNIMLAYGLLTKLGYTIPTYKYLSQVQVKFNSIEEKNGFIAYLEQEAMAGDAENWIIGEKNDLSIILQDVLAFEGQHQIYNLALGNPPEAVIEDKRILRSLAIAYALVNVPESVNLWRWQMGRVADKSIILDLNYADVFNCTFEDARWIGRRIEKLKRADFEEIVEFANVPKPVGALLIEKLMARRNSLMDLLKLDASDLPVNDKISSGVELVEGKLTQEYWPGYASRFAFGDPDSPLSASELMSWGKSKGLSYMIDTMVAGINSIPQLSTNIQKINDKEIQDYLTKNLLQTASGAVQAMPLDTWTVPTYNGQIGLSRSLVAGSYLGTDNLVQLADSLSVSVDAGLYTGIAGLFPSFGNLSANLALSRSYAHLRPVTSVKKSLKYPFKNLFVPLVHMDYGKKLSEIIKTNFEEIPETERIKKIEELLKPIKENLEIGESLIVTDTLGASMMGKIAYNKSLFVRAQLGLGANQTVLRRIHIHRKSENTVHVYQDQGESSRLQLYFAFNSVLPVLKSQGALNRGQAVVKYFTLSLNAQNPKILDHLAALRNVLIRQSIKSVQKISKPFIIKHKYKETGSNLGLLSFRLNHINAYTRMSVENPRGGEPRYFFRRYRGQTSGNDFQDYFNDIVSNTVALLFKTNLNPSSSSTNPGYSFLGKAKNKLNTFEAEITKEGKILEPFMKFNRIYNGWSIQREKAQKILQEIRNRYRFEFFEPTVLSSTQKMYLYNININFLIYRPAIESMLAFEEKKVSELFKEHRRRKSLVVNNATEEPVLIGVNRFIKFQRKANEALKKDDLKTYSRLTQKAFNLAEKKLNIEGLKILLGGDENFYVFARIDGFRVGDEDGDNSVISNSLGEFGNKNYFGPLQDLVGKTEMIEGEFFLYWMMTRLI